MKILVNALRVDFTLNFSGYIDFLAF